MTTLDELTTRMIEIGKRLRVARETAGLSVGQATVEYLKHVGLGTAPYPDNVTVIKQLESGIDITALEIVLLAHIYGASETWILTGINPDFDAQAFVDFCDGKLSPEDLEKMLRLMEVVK